MRFAAVAVLDELRSQNVAAIRTGAQVARDEDDEAVAEELETKANLVEEWPSDSIITAHMLSLVELAGSKSSVEKGLAESRRIVKILREAHATVDEWIMTDVRIDGAKVAELLEKALSTESGGEG